MKRNIILALILKLATLTALAQGIVGTWESDEIEAETGGSGTCTWKFEPNGKAIQEIYFHESFTNIKGAELRVIITAPGLYFIEEEKALTFNFDRSKIDIKFDFLLDENELVKNGLPADKILLFKQYLNEQMQGKREQLKMLIKQSAIVQILYNDGRQMVFASPQDDFWKGRNEMFRIIE